MTISMGFFGDSFCAASKSLSVNTYISMLREHYNATITNVGKHATSIEDLILLQFNPMFNSGTLPDISIFVWTDPHRFFHRVVRGITGRTITMRKRNDSIWSSAVQYYNHLHDYEAAELRYTAILHYMDEKIFSTLGDKTKIIHMWSFGNVDGDITKPDTIKKIDYYHRWKNGVEIRPPMGLVAFDKETEIEEVDIAPNHLRTVEKNQIIFERIKKAIDNYNSGQLINE